MKQMNFDVYLKAFESKEISDSYITWLEKEFDYKWFNQKPNYGMDIALEEYLIKYGVFYPKIYGSKELSLSITSEVLERSYSFMKKYKKHFIYIIEETEGYWESLNHHRVIHMCCEKTGVPADRIVYMNNDITLEERYNEWFDKQSKYKTKINVISHPFLLMNFSKEYNRLMEWIDFPKYEIVKYKDRKTLPTKKFMCLMGNRSWIREHLWYYFTDFANHPLKEKDGYVSYLGKNVTLPNSWNDKKASEDNILNGESSPAYDNLHHYFKDSYFSIIPETSNGIYVSEKTTKVLYHGHPFILIYPAVDIEGPKTGMLEKLREWGFETFSELFDESYDDLPLIKQPILNTHHAWYEDLKNDENKFRLQFILKNIKKLVDMDIKDLHKLCESVEEKCIHNQKTFLNLKEPYETLLIKLKNIVKKQK